MVGGKIVQIHEDKLEKRTWVNTHDVGDYCAIWVEGVDLPMQLGDKLWWQMGNAYWTAQPGQDVLTKEGWKDSDTFRKIGGSGVLHPLGKEYQLTYNFEKIADQRKEKIKDLKELVNGFLATTPTDAGGGYDPINQFQAFKADKYLKEHKV